MPRKETQPLSQKKDKDQYSMNALSVSSRQRAHQLNGVSLMLHRAKGADRRAKHKALTKLKNSGHYKQSTPEEKKMMEQDVEHEVQDRRDSEGISAASIEGNILCEMAKERDLKRKEERQQLESAAEQKLQLPYIPRTETRHTLAERLEERTRLRLRKIVRRQEWIFSRKGHEMLARAEDPNPDTTMKEFRMQVLEPTELLEEEFHEGCDEPLPGEELFLEVKQIEVGETTVLDDDIISLEDSDGDEDDEYGNEEADEDDEEAYVYATQKHGVFLDLANQNPGHTPL